MIWPFENDTSKIIKKLAVADLKAHKLKTFLSGVIILIATCLMAIVFMFLLNDAMEQVHSSTYHAMYRTVDNDTIEKIENNTNFSKVGIYKYFGGIVDKEGRTDIAYMDTNTMEFLGYNLVEGNMPTAENEILISAAYLHNHNLPTSIGSSIRFSYTDTFTNKKVDKVFTLSGIIENKAQESTKQFYIITSNIYRKQTILQIGNVVSSKFNSQRPDGLDILVRLNKENTKLDKNSQKDLLRSFGNDLGIKSYNIVLNNMYIEGIVLEPTQLIILVFFALLIMFASSFVIYSIFYISIVNSIQMYAQMLSLGTTPRQLKMFLKMQGHILMCCFIPIGMIVSLVITTLFSSTKWILYDVLILFAVGILIVIVIKLSLKKPAKILASISPIEAMKYTNPSNMKNRKELGHITPTNLAKNSLYFHRKKNHMSVISLSISGTLIIAMTILIGSTDLKTMMLQYYPLREDFMVSIRMDNFYQRFSQISQNNPFTDDFIEKINSIVGVKKVIKNQCVVGIMSEPKFLDLDGKTLNQSIGSISPELIENAMELVSGSISIDDLGDDGIIINQFRISQSSYDYGKIKVGDIIKFQIVSGDSFIAKEFRVVGIAYFSATKLFYTSPKIIETLTPYNGTTHISVFCDPESHDMVQSELENIISKNSDLTLKVYDEEYSVVKNWMNAMMWSIYGICLFVVFFGILNMLNILINSAIIRKREFALLQAVGMTEKQLRQMLYREGMSISGKSVIVSSILGLIIGKGLCYLAREVMALKFIEFHFILWPLILFAVLLIGLQMLVSKFICKAMKKNTLTERLRTE
ncbi:ABC transporter permease [Clostridium lundense]|uniref:ABC transporter permease n=1 Tax=Clostridium lundense TaxID=319475 RepID=UPI000687A35E|nr:ABC transporter permease [Clostridium lundense]